MIGAAYAGSKEGQSGDNFRPKRWTLSIGFRKQRSHRHFVGTEEQKQREEQRTQIVNSIYLMDVNISYDITPRYSVFFSIPFMSSSRTRPATLDLLRGIKNAPNQVSRSNGFGDASIGGRMWLFNPTPRQAAKGNIAIGVSLKMPTGDEGVTDVVQTATGPREIVVDQSIQLGDGGWGLGLSVEAYKRVRRATVYGSAAYLINPRDTNGVQTGRGRASEAIMSVPDQYLARAGVVYPILKRESWGLSASFGLRMEGVPVRDLIGKSNGFRRPGYGLSIEPGLTLARGNDVWSLTVPVAVKRNRKRSVTDIIDNTSGDAAFADYLITFGYSRRF